MGTRADFYIGRGPDAEWVGSIAMDGYPPGHPRAVLDCDNEYMFRKRVADIFAEVRHATLPEHGWPWPWDNSNTTDYAYALDGSQVYLTCFGHGWVTPNDYEHAHAIDDDPFANVDDIPDDQWPDMSERQNVTYGARSGLIMVGT